MKYQKTDELIVFLLECGALKFGDFKLKSGVRSPFFIDIGHISSGKQLCTLGTFLAEGIHDLFPDTTVCFGPAYKGISLAVAASTSYWQMYRRDMATLFDRKEAKVHGEGGTYIGSMPKPSDRVLLIDDVITSGLTKHECINRLKQDSGISNVDILVVVDRRGKSKSAASDSSNSPGDDLKFSSLLNIVSIIDYLNRSDDNRADIIREWWETS